MSTDRPERDRPDRPRGDRPGPGPAAARPARRRPRPRRPRARAGAGALPAVADRQPARRERAQRPVQLGLRPPLRRHLRAARRGHRRRPQPGRVLPGPLRLAGLARPRLGRGSRRRRARTRRTSRASAATSTATSPRGCSSRAPPTAATARARRSRRARRARPKGVPSGYDGFCRNLPAERVEQLESVGAPSVVRMRVPDADIVFDDLVRGEVRFAAEHVPDYVLVRANGEPLYTLVNPVDDALMEITHVLRGEDLLPSTPRQVVLYEALARIGVGSGRTPRFGHLPTVLGEGNRRLSKRDKGAGLAEYREQGYLPEGLLNYLALLGWSIAEDRDVFTLAEMVEAFDILRVNANPARFDPRKCEAINASHIRLLGTDGADRGAGAVLRQRRARRRPADAGAARAARRRDARWSRSASRPSPRPSGWWRSCSSGDGDLVVEDGLLSAGSAPCSAAAHDALAGAGDVRRRVRSRRRCAPRSSTGSGSSRATRSARSGPRSRGARSRRRCSSRWSCSAGSRPWPGSPRPPRGSGRPSRRGALTWRPSSRAQRPPQRSGNPAVRGGVQPPRDGARRGPSAPPPKEFLPGPAARRRRAVPARPAQRRDRLVALGARRALRALALPAAGHPGQPAGRPDRAGPLTHPVDYRTYYAQALAYERPVGLLASNLGIATLIPISLALVLVIHHARTHWLFSVRPGIRWRYLLVCLGGLGGRVRRHPGRHRAVRALGADRPAARLLAVPGRHRADARRSRRRRRRSSSAAT